MVTARYDRSASAQNSGPGIKFHSGQAVYIVGFRDSRQLVVRDSVNSTAITPSNEHFLDLEKKVDEQLRKWGYFRIVARPSDAEFFLLVYTDMSSIEGLAVSPEVYRIYFKDKFDLDQFRDGAFVRGTAGPLNLPTLSRLTERMVKQLREKIETSGP